MALIIGLLFHGHKLYNRSIQYKLSPPSKGGRLDYDTCICSSSSYYWQSVFTYFVTSFHLVSWPLITFPYLAVLFFSFLRHSLSIIVFCVLNPLVVCRFTIKRTEQKDHTCLIRDLILSKSQIVKAQRLFNSHFTPLHGLTTTNHYIID